MLGLGLSDAAARAARSMIGYPTPTLDLSMMHGVLDSRVTFTRASPGTYTDSEGVLASASTNAPRFDHDPVTLAPKGLLIEEARTNLALRSAELGNASWTKIRATVVSDAAVAPDGTLSADKLVEDATAANTHLTLQSVTGTSTVVHTFSFFAKSAERTRLQVQIDAGGASGGLAAVDLTTGIGSVTAGTGSPTLSVNAMGNGWWRIALTAIPAAAGTTVRGVVYLADAAGATTYTGDATSGLLLWGMQIEAGASATSYLATQGSTASRAVDVAVIGTLTPWFNASEGTLMVEASRFGAGAFGRLAQFDDGTTSANSIAILTGSAGLRTYAYIGTANVSQFDTSASANDLTLGVPAKAAIAYKANDAAFCFNGGGVSTDTSVTLPTVTQLRIGAPSALHGHIRRVKYFNSRLANATLQSITA